MEFTSAPSHVTHSEVASSADIEELQQRRRRERKEKRWLQLDTERKQKAILPPSSKTSSPPIFSRPIAPPLPSHASDESVIQTVLDEPIEPEFPIHQQRIRSVVTHLYCCVALFSHVPCTRRQRFNQFPFLAACYVLLLPSEFNIFCKVNFHAVCLVKLGHVFILHPASHVNPNSFCFSQDLYGTPYYSRAPYPHSSSVYMITVYFR